MEEVHLPSVTCTQEAARQLRPGSEDLTKDAWVLLGQRPPTWGHTHQHPSQGALSTYPPKCLHSVASPSERLSSPSRPQSPFIPPQSA